MTQMTKAKALHVLGLPHYAPAGDIRAAWRRLVFEMHPDRGGTPDDLARINAAYDILRAEPVRARPAEARPAARPELRTRILRVNTETRAGCTEAMAAAAASADAGYDPWGAIPEADHVPDTIRRKGRSVSYVLARPLSPGTNRIAIPGEPTGTRRRAAPRIVTIECAGDGTGSYELPEAERATLFPGSRRVRIHFGTG